MKNLRLLILFFALLPLLVCSCSQSSGNTEESIAAEQPQQTYTPQEGDIVFQSIAYKGDLVKAIEGVTESPWSHCGLVVKDANGKWAVLEASATVRAQPLEDWYKQGTNGDYVVTRLQEKYATPEFIAKFVAAARKRTGKPYDIRYEFDDAKIYCSELVWKGFHDATNGESLGKVVKFGDLNWKPYAKFIKQIEGGPVPVEREMITPRDLMLASQTKIIYDSRKGKNKKVKKH